LFPGVRILVAIQQPKDLDTAYSLALLYEEFGEDCGPIALPVQPAVSVCTPFFAITVASSTATAEMGF
jgi:hypothetical protein